MNHQSRLIISSLVIFFGACLLVGAFHSAWSSWIGPKRDDYFIFGAISFIVKLGMWGGWSIISVFGFAIQLMLSPFVSSIQPRKLYVVSGLTGLISHSTILLLAEHLSRNGIVALLFTVFIIPLCIGFVLSWIVYTRQ